MITSCPECASVVDMSESLCRDCGWSVPYLSRRPTAKRPDVSFSERYRGTPFQAPQNTIVLGGGGMAKGRMFVSFATVAICGVVGLIVLSGPRI